MSNESALGMPRLSARPWFGPAGAEVLSEDGGRVLCRGWHHDADDPHTAATLAVFLASEHPAPALLDRLTHEYELRDWLDGRSTVRPRALVRESGQTVLLLDDPGGQPLDRCLGRLMELGPFLRIGISLSTALHELHEKGIIHKDIKPTNVLVDSTTDQVWLTGFGIASRLPRERQAPAPPEVIAGTLAYMAPEQTGRMNRSVDARSDLYALGVTLYEMLTGQLPFAASDPMEWVHCHIARRPVPPDERRRDLPRATSAIVMKLIAKTPEERYQTAFGLESDLRRCLAGWEAQRRIDDFPLGEHDWPDRLLIPEKLYGREREVETLLTAFDRVVSHATPELVLVSGHSGVGKTSVVNELHKVLVPRGLFASGKFDQYKRDIPFATLAQAFQSLIRPLLSKSDTELVSWRHALLEALGPNGRLMTDLMPELTLIIGDQPPAPELPPQQAQSRFQLVFQRFIDVFARPEHPLALFLDDLQWLDAATLDLLEDLFTRSDLQYLMLIGAYRDNEVTATHPLIRKLDAIKAAGGKVAEITLTPLAREHLGQLIADALRCEAERAAPLAGLTHEKTGGNPFFAIQFLSSLAEEALITFDHGAACWSWDLDRIHTKGYTDNVVDLMVGKLIRLPADAQNALQQLACLGNIAEITTLSVVLGIAKEQVDTALWPARRQELVERMAGTYRFVHDRVQEAAYSTIPKELRIEAHLRIGRLLAAHTPPEKREEAIFDIVNQLNRGASLITSMAEREQLAELNLLAGQRAKASTAYLSALTYLTCGLALLPADGWQRRRELALALEVNRAECEFLTGALAEAEQRLEALSARTTDVVERATVARLRVELYVALDRSDRAVVVGLDFLRHLGIEWSPRPTAEEARREYQRIWLTLGDRSIEEVVASPPMTDPKWCATMDVLNAVISPALFTDRNLPCLVICRMANLSLEHGISDAGCFAYTWLGNLIGPHFGAYQEGFRFGKLGLDLTEQRGLRRFEARVYLVFGNRVIPWTQPIRTGRSLIRRAFDSANKLGDLTFAGYSSDNLIAHLLATGDGLGEVQREAENGFEFAQKARFGLVVDTIKTQLQLIRTLRGLTPTFGAFDEEGFDERLFEQHLASNRALALAEVWYWIRKAQARYLSGDYASAIAAATNAEPLLYTTPFFDLAEYHLYAALARAALCDAAGAAERAQHLEALSAHHRQLQAWAENCPENFQNRVALVGAEIARIEGRELDAERLYEQAIGSARANGFIHNEALAYELAARFYAARGFRQFAHLYLRNARYCYLRWGAVGKVRQLDEMYPDLRQEESLPGPTSTIGAPVEHLDLATVIKVSQAVSGEIVLENLIDTLMRTAMVQAGAERALLILPRWQEPRIEAEATTSGDTVTVRLVDEAVTESVLPESVLHYVLRTREIVILDDAAVQSPFGVDSYIRRRQARSILCLPLLNQAKLIGVLYLENNLTPRVFAPARISVLKLLASQAAIALENANLYRDVAEREKQQTATAKMLRIIANSPIQSVLDAVAENAARLCDANNVEIFRLEDNLLRLAASYGEIPVVIHAYQGVTVDRDTVTGRAACDRRTIHVHDLAAEEGEYPVGSSNAKREGHRTTLGTPLLREGTPVGIILVRRMEVRPFSGQQIALLETFADQAVIAIENARLFKAEQQRRLALAHANRDLAEREAKIRRLVDSNIIGIFIWDFNGRIVEANDEFLRMVNYEREDLVSGHIMWADLTPPDWRDRNNARIEQQKSSGRFEPFEKEYTRKDGSRVPVLIGGATFEEGGNQGVAFVLDLTERKRAEDRLRVQHTVAQILAEAATIEEVTPRILRAMGESLGWDVGALWRVTREAEALRCVALWHKASIEVPEFERVSREFTVVPGLGLPGRVWSSLEPEYIPDVVSDENFPRGPIAEREGLHAAFGFPILLGGEVLGVIEFFSHEIRQPDQELLKMLATIGSQIGQFIERRRAESELRESEQNYRTLFESIDEGFCTIEVLFDESGKPVDYRFLQISPSFERQTGIENAAGRRMREIAPQHEEHWFEIYGRIALTGEPMRFENEAKQLGRWYDVYAFRVEDPKRRRVGILFNDITERKRAEAEIRDGERRYREAQLELAHANRVATMGQLTSSIAHEVNQPITAAVTYALAARRFLSAEPPNFHEVDDALSLIVKEGNRAGDVVGRVRALIKKAPARKDAVEINDAILEVIALTRTEAANNSVSVRTQLAEGLPRVQGDRVQLQQVLLNLIINAIEAMRDVGDQERELLISTCNEPDGVLVEVRDSGPGFAPAALERVFEAFYTTKPDGVGLGLSICRSIIEAHNGRLWASPNVPRGAIFRFIAPVHPDVAS
jgi:PAS domain S-box-containing protein